MLDHHSLRTTQEYLRLNRPGLAKRAAPAQARRFLEAITAERLYPLFLTALTTGMRRGELAGLTWSDVDLEHRNVVVSRALVVAAHKLVTSTTKTDRARVIAIDPATVDVLREHRQRQLEERLMMGAGWRDRGLVFAAHDGEPDHPNVISRTFDRLVARTRLPRIRSTTSATHMRGPL